VELIRRNLEALGVGADRCELVPGTARHAIGRLAQRGPTFAAGWCDPPFAQWDDGLADLALAAQQRLFAAGALVVLEVPPRRDVAVPGFAVVRALRGAVLLRAVSGPVETPAPV
jgi:hypothetical protein